jgi:hypothetical protein
LRLLTPALSSFGEERENYKNEPQRLTAAAENLPEFQP